MQPGDTSVKTGVVGVAYSATARALISDKTTANVTLNLYAAWVDWPFSNEYNLTLSPGDFHKHTEHQSRASNFYVNLTSNGRAAALGRVTLE